MKYKFKNYLIYLFLCAFFIPVFLHAGWRCSECGRIPPNGGYYCSECGKWISVADAELVETKNESSFLGLPSGDHFHVYKCPKCGGKTTVYIGNIDRIRRENSEEFNRNVDELDKNLKELDQALQSCFIATAAYGTPLEPEVEILSEFRDIYLLSNPVGSVFVSIYYIMSPPLARIIAKSEILREITKVILTPFVITTYPFVLLPEILQHTLN